MLRSLLPPEFFKLPRYTVSKPITVTAVSIRLVLRSDALSHVSLTLLLPSALPTFFFFFSRLLVFFPAWVFGNWSFHLSFRYMSLFSPCLCTCFAASPLIQIQYTLFEGSWNPHSSLLWWLEPVTSKFIINSIGIEIETDRYGSRFYVYMYIYIEEASCHVIQTRCQLYREVPVARSWVLCWLPAQTCQPWGAVLLEPDPPTPAKIWMTSAPADISLNLHGKLWARSTQLSSPKFLTLRNCMI